MAIEELPFINSSFREFPLDVQLALADYKLYGEKSYAFRNKKILNRIYLTSSIVKYEDSIIVDAFDFQLKKNVKKIFNEIDVEDIKNGTIDKYLDFMHPGIILCIFRSSEIEKFKDMYSYPILEKMFLSDSFLTSYISLITSENCNSLFDKIIKNNDTINKLIELSKTEIFRKKVNYSLINYSIPKLHAYTKGNTVDIQSLFKDPDFLFCISSIWTFATSSNFNISNKFGRYASVNTKIGNGYTYNMEGNMNGNTSAFIYKDVMGDDEHYGSRLFESDSTDSDHGLVSMVFRRK